MTSSPPKFSLTEVSLLEPTQGKMHWRLSLSSKSDRVETWALQAAWKNKSAVTPVLNHLSRRFSAPWGGSFTLGPITLYPRQERTIEVFSDLPPEPYRLGELELHWQFSFDESFGEVHMSNVSQIQG